MPNSIDAEALLNSVLDALPDAVITITEEGLIASYSHAAQRMLGYQVNEVIGQNVKMLMPTPYRDEHDGYMDHYKATHLKKIIGIGRELEAQRKDGSVFPIHLDVSEMFVQGRRMFTGIMRDQSKLKHAESRTRQYAQIVEDSVNEIYIVDAMTYQVVHGNRAARQNLGYSIDEMTDLKTWDFLEGLNEADIEGLVEPLREGSIDKTDFEFAQIRKDGSIYPVRTQLQYLKEQQPPVFVAVVQDISELKAELSRSDQLGAILDRSLNEIYMFEADSLRFVQANFGAKHNIGYTSEELLEMTPVDIKPEMTVEEFEQVIAPLRDGSKDLLVFNTVHQRKDGSTYPVDVALQQMRSDEKSLFVAIIRDISEQHKMSEDLLLRDRAIAEVDNGVLITDARNNENSIIYSNAAMTKMTGYEAEEMLGQNPRFLQGDDRDQPALDNIRAAISKAVPVHETLQNYRKDGSRFMTEVTISPIHDDAGNVTHYVGVQSDVTAKLDMEARLRQSQKMDAIGQLAGGIAHDFNNLLTVVIGNNELLADRLGGDELSASLLDDATSAAESGAQLTGQLLSSARQQPLAPKAINLNELVQDLSGMLSRTLGETITLNTKLTDRLGRPFVDPAQLHNALLNLAINARDAMPEGGDLTIDTSVMDFDVDMARERDELAPGRYARLTVSDTGIGMPPEIQSRVFEPFFTTKELGKGTGLGLSMVHGFAKQSGGHLEIYSEPNQGTSVSLYLPYATGLADGYTGRIDDISPVEKGAEVILVVEDDARVRKTTVNRLDHLGYEILQAETGQQALDILAEDSAVDLIFTDMVMPGGISGADLTVEVRKLYPHIRCIITSGYAEPNTIPSDGTLWLRKPYKLQDMSQMFRQLLD
jgi:PAS domain S-box-containing protein